MELASSAPPIVPRRKVEGISATLLPFDSTGAVDWLAFDRHLERTIAAGLIPAVNMDTGFVNLLDEASQTAVLDRTIGVLSGERFVAGAFVGDAPGAVFDLDAYRRRIDAIQNRGGTPVIFPSYGLTSLSDDGVVEAHRRIAEHAPRFIAFELGEMFVPFGRIYSLEAFRGLMRIRECVGAKHSSLRRQPEWDRLRLRDAVRPDFRVYTGNDLAIDMTMYGSDYLLGLSTFAPDVFAKRDAAWASGDPAFHELNDVLQYLGCYAFRPPTPAYKHAAAMFLKLRGWIDCDDTHPRGAPRPESDRAVLMEILGWMERIGAVEPRQ